MNAVVKSAAEVTCPCCLERTMEPFYEVQGVPTNSCILLSTREEALRYPTGDIRLAFCPGCGFISNIAFDAKLTEYSGRYEETQAFSPTFNSFHERLARSLVERHALKDKDLIEIGCGKGEFLKLLCDLGENRGLGFDPGYSEARGESAGASRFSVVRDFFSERYVDRDADFVACKMTLEHIWTPHKFISAAVRLVRQPAGTVFIQVPESLRILKECSFEDIYYEHCSYFTGGSLSRLFRQLGLKVSHIDVEYDGQYLTVEAVPAANSSVPVSVEQNDLEELRALVKSFPARDAEKRGSWAKRLQGWGQAGKRVVLWGSGSKGVSFLTTIPGAHIVEDVVDINPYRHGYFMPRTGQQIIAPEKLQERKPDVVVVMNRIYVPEIQQQLAKLGLHPEVVAL
jgi:2-polyprenyl-3-methyl-5-hydroxy-6-metoxy-1,4-benzoquinol methylase